MRYADMRDVVHERAALLDKKRLGKNQKVRVATLSSQLDDAHQPPPTPPRNNTGLDAQGQSAADDDGSAWQLRLQAASPSLRQRRRNNKTGRFDIQPYRSRIQRQTRRQRTGGVK